MLGLLRVLNEEEERRVVVTPLHFDLTDPDPLATGYIIYWWLAI